jgi:hypothetical protein
VVEELYGWFVVTNAASNGGGEFCTHLKHGELSYSTYVDGGVAVGTSYADVRGATIDLTAPADYQVSIQALVKPDGNQPATTVTLDLYYAGTSNVIQTRVVNVPASSVESIPVEFLGDLSLSQGDRIAVRAMRTSGAGTIILGDIEVNVEEGINETKVKQQSLGLGIGMGL